MFTLAVRSLPSPAIALIHTWVACLGDNVLPALPQRRCVFGMLLAGDGGTGRGRGWGRFAAEIAMRREFNCGMRPLAGLKGHSGNHCLRCVHSCAVRKRVSAVSGGILVVYNRTDNATENASQHFRRRILMISQPRRRNTH